MPIFNDDPVVSNATGSQNAIEGVSVDGRGVVGKSEASYGIRGHSSKIAGIRGSSDAGRGVEGWATESEGVVGLSKTGAGIWGQTDGPGEGVRGTSTVGRGVNGISKTSYGVAGDSQTSAGVRGTSVDGRGVEGWSTKSEGVVGISTNSTGVWGQTDGAGIGVAGTSKSGVGILGRGGRLAGLFEGSVEVTGGLTLQNVDVLALLHRLQQLEPLLAELESLRAAAPRLLSVRQLTPPELRPGGVAADYLIVGENFRPGASIHISFHTSNQAQGGFQNNQVVPVVDSNGRLNVQATFFCSAGAVFRMTAIDDSAPSFEAQRSNTITDTVRAVVL